MADVEVVPVKQQNERVSYLVHQDIKHGKTSASLPGWMNCETDVWWKIHFQKHINYFSTDSDRILAWMLLNNPFFSKLQKPTIISKLHLRTEIQRNKQKKA